MASFSNRIELFSEICSQDFLQFKFGDRGYQDQLYDAIAKTQVLAGVKVECVDLPFNDVGGSIKVVWISHNFGFLGGSLGCAEGEKISRGFEYGLENNLPVCVQCRSGGARMQEGTSSLMQMAKVSVAVQALRNKGIPFISILSDPTYGGVSASYAMQADIRIAVNDARIGFAGPSVILNTMCEGNQLRYDDECPADFQAAKYVYDNGQVDLIINNETKNPEELQQLIERKTASILNLIHSKEHTTDMTSQLTESDASMEDHLTDKNDYGTIFNYTKSRSMLRPQTQDIISNVFSDYTELSGDGKVGRDACMKGGVASFQGVVPCVVIATTKGHTPTDMQSANYGMPSPHGYRTADRLMQLAERFNLPIITLVDTVGAWPTFQCEKEGQSEAIATNLTRMAGLRVPIITLIVGEGGSGGALGICMGNVIGMLSGGYFGVISPEGAASILGRYKNEVHKQTQFPLDCQELAKAQHIYAYQLKALGVVDEIIWENDILASLITRSNPTTVLNDERHDHFPNLKSRIIQFISKSLKGLKSMDADLLVSQRYGKYRAIGSFATIPLHEERLATIADAKQRSLSGSKPIVKKKVETVRGAATAATLIQHLAEEIVRGTMSSYRKLSPSIATSQSQIHYPMASTVSSAKVSNKKTAKNILDEKGPAYLCKEWIKSQSRDRVLLTDTTMRDAHQSLLATRVRTIDLVCGAKIAQEVLHDAFSLEMWGGATFDVCMRFLDECPWQRLREIRKACPDICLQMLIRGANAVGYTSYADNVVSEFIRLAAENGMDIFRIFDCFNSVDSMLISIETVLKANKVAEVCICYTGNLLTSSIYNVEYYHNLAKEIKATGAHIIGIKDMAGLLRPYEAEPLMTALRAAVGDEIPIHFHTHATSSGSLATCMEMARLGCDIIDFATASMADGTSQPSLNAFVAMMEGAKRGTGFKYMELEPYDMYWAKVRDLYSPFESGMKAGTARVFEHQIPGGQYSNLIVQCQAMELYYGDKWEKVLDAYRDVNMLFGDIIKVTPSSKCVGDLALYLVNRGMTTKDLLDASKSNAVDFPESVVGLLKGDLGFPHRGFPVEIEKLVLKDGQIPKRTVRAGLVLPAVDFNSNIAKLEKEFQVPISPEEGMSSLMYPKVFSDYITRRIKKGSLLPYLPTVVYFYGFLPGNTFTMKIPTQYSSDLFLDQESTSASSSSDDMLEVKVELLRITAPNKMKRTVEFQITPLSSSSASSMKPQMQYVEVKDTAGVFVFDGPMADTSKPTEEIASPMPGIIEKVMVVEGQQVKSGDILCIVSAMKMEVKVTSPSNGKISSVAIPATGYRVVEGALLMKIQQ